jgi:hypothetical protein
MASAAVTLTVTSNAGGGYKVTFHTGAPGAKGKSSKADEISPTAFQSGGPLHPDSVAQILGTRAHQLADLHRIGDDMAATFLAGTAGQGWRKAAGQARDAHRAWLVSQQGLEPVMRTYLRIEPSELQVLPWELCRIDDENIFFERALPVARALGGSLANPAPLREWPTRVLAIIGADTGGLEPDREVRELGRLLRRYDHVFDYEVFDCSRLSGQDVVTQLKARLTDFKPHILHFAGHASYMPSALQLGPDEQDPNHWWRAEDISAFLNATGGWTLQFAFLNACRTQRPPGAADSFVRAFAVKGNALAVVTMCADVRGSDAAQYAAHAYSALADGVPLDQAIGMARGAVGVSKLAAYYAGVSTSAALDALLSLSPSAPSDRRQRLELLDGKPGIKEFVDRVPHRRQLLTSISKGANAVLITGDSDLGKTWFVQSCCRSLAWQGHPVLYCNLTKQKGWAEFLLTLLHGGDEPGLSPPVDRQTVDSFVRRLGSGSGTSLAGGDITATAQSVLTVLEALGTKEKPLILALDHLDTWEAASGISRDVPTIFLSVFKPIANGDGRIRLLLSCVSASVYANEQLTGNWTQLPLTAFPATELNVLLREMMLAKQPTDDQMARAASYLALTWNADLPPRTLAFMCETFWKSVRGNV